MTMYFIKRKFYNAFTLIENLTVFTILGIILALVVPKIISANTKKTNQITLRKAVMNYQSVLQKTAVLNSGVMDTSDLNKLIRGASGNCQVLRGLLSAETVSSGNGCIFMTSDHIWWDASTPSQTIITIGGQQELNFGNAADPNNKNTFWIPFQVTNDNGIYIHMLTVENPTNQQREANNKTITFLMNNT